jgi:hypothetical protein
MRKLLTVILLSFSYSVFAAGFTVDIKDVFDIATYGDVFHQEVLVDKNQDTNFNFFISSWGPEHVDQGYSIKISGEGKYLEDGAYYIKFKKELFFHETLVKTLVDKNFLLNSNNSSVEIDDDYWSPEQQLVLRQTNILRLE